MPQLNTRLRGLPLYGDPNQLFTVKMFPPPEDKLFTLHSEYRYIFRGPARQMNHGMIRMVIRAICELSRDNMLFAAAGLWPHNMDETLPIWPGHEGGARKLYTFTQKFEEFPMTTEISIVRGTTKLTTDDILIRKKRKGKDADRDPWTPLKDWLLSLPLPCQLTQGTDRRGIRRSILTQQIWWANTGKSFRLIALPPGVRAIIFQQALGGNIYPSTCYDYATRNTRVPLGSRGHNVPPPQDNAETVTRFDMPNLAIFQLNNSLRKEALQAGFEGIRKCFTDFYCLE